MLKYSPHYGTLALVGRLYNDPIIVETYTNGWTPGMVVTPRSVGGFVHYSFPLITKHTLLKSCNEIRKFFRVWFNPASACGFRPDLRIEELSLEMLSLSELAGLPQFPDVHLPNARTKFGQLLKQYQDFAEAHERALQPITEPWLKMLQSLQNADRNTIRAMRSKHKGNPGSRTHVCEDHDPQKRVTVWEHELSENLKKNWRQLRVSERLPKYEVPNRDKFNKLMNERLEQALGEHAKEWQVLARLEAAQGVKGEEAPDPATITAPFVVRVRYWVESECADIAALIHHCDALSGETGSRAEYTNRTFASHFFADELYLRKMCYLIAQMELEDEKKDKVGYRVARCMFYTQDARHQINTEEGLFGALPMHDAVMACRAAPFKKDYATPEVWEETQNHAEYPGTVFAYVATQVAHDAKMRADILEAHRKKSKKKQDVVV